MNIKITKLSNSELEPFKNMMSAMCSLPTLQVSGIYPAELTNCGINQRGTPNKLLGYVVTQPSGSPLAIETVFYDPKDGHDNGDLHIVNFEANEIASHYQGWGTWTGYYGDQHWVSKDYLRIGTNSTVNFDKNGKTAISPDPL